MYAALLPTRTQLAGRYIVATGSWKDLWPAGNGLVVVVIPVVLSVPLLDQVGLKKALNSYPRFPSGKWGAAAAAGVLLLICYHSTTVNNVHSSTYQAKKDPIHLPRLACPSKT